MTIQQIDDPNDLMSILYSRTNQSRTTQLWVDVMIKPVPLMLFCRAEKEADWALLLFSLHDTLCIFSARHPNYAHFGLYYLCSVEAMPHEILEKFMNGDHAVRYGNRDRALERVPMASLVSLKTNTLKTWALSLHTSSVLAKDISNMTSE